MILAIKTDQPQAELKLLEAASGGIVDEISWQAHRELSDTILTNIDRLLKNNNHALNDVTALIVFEGPGSFTGLRIGISVANTLSYALDVPVVGAGTPDWVRVGTKLLQNQKGFSEVAVPQYGAPAHITTPRK